MASVTVTLPDDDYDSSLNGIWWTLSPRPNVGAVSNSSSTVLGYVSLPRITFVSLQIWLARNQTEEVTSAGPDFTSAMEEQGTITIAASNGASVTMGGPNAPGSNVLDDTEPYAYQPSNIVDVRVFANAVQALADRSVTVTFNDNAEIAPSFTDNTGDAQTWTQNQAITAITVPEADGEPAPTYAPVGSLPAGIAFNATTRVLSGTPTAAGSGTITIRATNSAGTADWTVAYSIAAAVVSIGAVTFPLTLAWSVSDIEVEAPLALDDFDQEGESLVLALFTHGATDAYSSSSGTLHSGSDVDVTDNLTVNRVRILNLGVRLRINRSGSDRFDAYFEGSGDYVDASFYVQTQDRVITLTLLDAGGGFINFDVPTADQAHLNGLGEGDRFILAITIPEVTEVEIGAVDIPCHPGVGCRLNRG